MNLAHVRRQFWHFRHKGYRAAIEFRRRSNPTGRTEGVSPTKRRILRRGPQLRFPDFDITTGSGPKHEITAAVILDDFSRTAFGFEWLQVELSRKGWLREIESARPDLLFVESAWSGNKGEWQYQLTGTTGPKTSLRALVEHCRASGIPTVFWNKEDPPHYSDFLETARLFDFVFTSDSNRVGSYKSDLGHERVAVLQFAAQPAIHNPIRPREGWHTRDIAFAGMYFAHKYPERRAQLDLLLSAAMTVHGKTKPGLEIFSRHSTKDKNYRFPAPFSDRVVGSLPYEQMLTAYKAYKVFLNVNSVVDSPSMCARRIFEITAAGTTVVSAPSRALKEMWAPGEQFIVSDPDEASSTLRALQRNPELSDRQLHKAQRRIWEGHTYAHRIEQVAAACLPADRVPELKLPSVSLLVSTMRPHQLEHIFRTVGAFTGVDVELVLSTHGYHADPVVLEKLGQEYRVQDVVSLHVSSAMALGDSLNQCVRAASGDVLSKMDDDDFYGPNYLTDLLHALDFSGAEIVGKQAHYMYVASHDVTLMRFPEREHKFTHSVMGPTITGPRRVFEDAPFEPLARGEDSAFLSRVATLGGQIYAADRFNYAQYRGSSDHTWRISDIELIASGDVKFYGTPERHVII